jgi:hypothetical protein
LEILKKWLKNFIIIEFRLDYFVTFNFIVLLYIHYKKSNEFYIKKKSISSRDKEKELAQ